MPRKLIPVKILVNCPRLNTSVPLHHCNGCQYNYEAKFDPYGMPEGVYCDYTKEAK